MRPLQITLFIVALVVLGTQSFRHVYVKWIEPTESVLDEFREPVEEDISRTKTLDELVEMYRPALERVREYEQRAGSEVVPEYERRWTQPYKTAETIREAIERWEAQEKSLFELYFYWLVGLASIVIGLIAYARINRWLGMVGVITGFAEMAFWTSPLWRSWGPQAQFEKLLDAKLVLSLVSAALLVALWLWRSRAQAAARSGASGEPLTP